MDIYIKTGLVRLKKAMDALSVVTQLRDLASEPQNREAIVKDQGCLPGLVLFLDHKSPDVLLATLQVSLKRLDIVY